MWTKLIKVTFTKLMDVGKKKQPKKKKKKAKLLQCPLCMKGKDELISRAPSSYALVVSWWFAAKDKQGSRGHEFYILSQPFTPSFHLILTD